MYTYTYHISITQSINFQSAINIKKDTIKVITKHKAKPSPPGVHFWNVPSEFHLLYSACISPLTVSLVSRSRCIPVSIYIQQPAILQQIAG